MCDNKNELHKSNINKSMDNTSTRLDLDITETTDSYPEFDFLDLLRNLQVKERKSKHKCSSEDSTNKSNPFSEEDSDVEALAKLYEEKYGTCNDYAELGEGYDEEDSFIDNSDAVNDLVPSGIQTEFGGFYINRGKLNFVKEDNSSSSTSEDVDKFLAHNRLNTRKVGSDDENEEREISKSQSNNHGSGSAAGSSYAAHLISNSNNANSSGHNSNNHCNSHVNNNGSLHSNVIKSRKRSGEYQHKSKKIRKTATPKIPDHLLHKKPFPGSHEYRKNLKEFKKNRLKSVGTDKKSSSSTSSSLTNSVVNNSGSSKNANSSENNHIYSNAVNNNCSEDNEKEVSAVKKKPAKEFHKERDGASEVIEAVATGADIEDKQDSSSSETSDSSNSDSDSESSEDTSNEKEKTPVKTMEEVAPAKSSSLLNGFVAKDNNTAKSFAHLSGGLKELVAKIVEISKEEKNKFFNSKLNTLLLGMDERVRELPMAERNAILEYVADILQMKKDNITKRTKKLLVLQEEAKMSAPLRKLKDAVAAMMPLLESTYFNEYTKAAGTSPQIYAELSRYYWSIDSSSLPQRKFPWNDELRHYLREIVQYRKNCYYIIRPRKESLIDYIRSFMETKVKTFWPKEWMTVDILLEEAQVTSSTSSTSRHTEEKSKGSTKILGTQNSHKKISSSVLLGHHGGSRKHSPAPGSGSATSNRKSGQGGTKNPEVKSILIPRKTPQGTAAGSSKSNNSSSTSSQSQNPVQGGGGNRTQVSVNRMNVQEYLDRISGSQTSISRSSSNQQISPNRGQSSVSPSRLAKTSSPNSMGYANGSKNSSPGSGGKSVSSGRNVAASLNSQSVLKTIEIHSNPISGSKSSPNSVTISPVNESVFKDMTPSAEVLNLTKNSSVFISKVKDCNEAKQRGRSSSPSIGIPLPSGITISPTNASPSTFLVKPQKVPERNAESKINVSITKQDTPMSLTKEKRESVLNLNVKREGPLQNIPDCISVTSKMVPNERHRYEHVRKRALQEYHQQQRSPDRAKPEEKKMRKEEIQLADIEVKEDKFDDKNFSKIFDSVIAKTSETVRQSDGVTGSQVRMADRYAAEGSGLMGLPVKNPALGSSQFNKNSSKVRDVRAAKEKPYYSGEGEGNASADKKRYEDHEDRSESIREQRVQMEMDRVMQNLVELSREKKSEYNYEYEYEQHVPGTGYSTSSSALKPPNFQETLHKMFK